MSEDYKLDVIMPCFNRLDMTMRAVNALYSNTTAPFHLIIIDHSTDLTPLYFGEAQKEQSNITYHWAEDYKGGNHMFNIGLSYAKTPFVATVMTSLRVEPQWEEYGLKLMAEHPDVGIIGFKCLFPDGRIESAGIDIFNGYLPVDIGRDHPGHRFSGVYECPAVQWAFALLRKEAVIGNLEEDLFNPHVGWDDIDNSLTIRSKGWKIYYCGISVGYHTPRATRGDNSAEADFKNRQNGEMFYKRQGFWKPYCEVNKIDENSTCLTDAQLQAVSNRPIVE